GNKNDINQPGYTYQYDSDSSEIEDNPTNTITSLYRKIFKTQTKISGSMVMSFDKESIFSELLHDIEFCPYSISLADKLSIMIFSLEIIKPNPIISTPSKPKSLWTILIPNPGNTNSKHIRIHTPNENLEQVSNKIIDARNNFIVDAEFQLASGWALKANQKFGKRGRIKMSKKIITLLQDFFHA
ncbi:9122_t:CDS:2, partial [Funneliformis caledonium]